MLQTLSENPALARTREGDNWRAVLFGHYLFIGGKCSARAAREIAESMLAENVTLIYCPDDEWRAGLRAVLGDMNAWGRRLYARAPQKFEPKIAEIEKIDAAKLAKCGNAEIFIEEVIGTGTYSSMEDFFARGMGFAPIIGGDIRGFCTSEYPSENACAIGIEVEAEYRGRGWAKEMTRRFLTAAVEKGIKTVYWECWADNAPSVAVARACGFELMREYDALEYFQGGR